MDHLKLTKSQQKAYDDIGRYIVDDNARVFILKGYSGTGKTTLNEELAQEYGAIGIKACPMMKEGEVFMADYAKPEGFCDEAWKAIYQYVFALAHGAGSDLFYYGDWIRKPGVAIVSCNDGLRPVIMKLKATDIDANLEYTPVGR